MIEVYVYMEGANPKAVVLGRRQAVGMLLEGGFKTNPDELRRISLFMEANVCDLGTGLHLVGFPPGVPDRRIVRVVGPGSLV